MQRPAAAVISARGARSWQVSRPVAPPPFFSSSLSPPAALPPPRTPRSGGERRGGVFDAALEGGGAVERPARASPTPTGMCERFERARCATRGPQRPPKLPSGLRRDRDGFEGLRPHGLVALVQWSSGSTRITQPPGSSPSGSEKPRRRPEIRTVACAWRVFGRGMSERSWASPTPRSPLARLTARVRLETMADVGCMVADAEVML